MFSLRQPGHDPRRLILDTSGLVWISSDQFDDDDAPVSAENGPASSSLDSISGKKKVQQEEPEMPHPSPSSRCLWISRGYS